MVPGDKHPQLQDWQGTIDLGTLFAAGGAAQLTSPEGRRDIIFCLADAGMVQVIRGFLSKDRFHQSLGCGKFDFDPDIDIKAPGRGYSAPGSCARSSAPTRTP